MSVSGLIAASARSELPETWAKLEESKQFGPQSLELKINSIMTQVFGRALTEEEQTGLNARVLEYVGKLVALQLITPGRDYWAKQATSFSAGERESKSYTDRSLALKDLREDLLYDTRAMYPEISDLIPDKQRRRVDSPVVQDVAIAHTPSPYDFEPAYLPPDTESV